MHLNDNIQKDNYLSDDQDIKEEVTEVDQKVAEIPDDDNEFSESETTDEVSEDLLEENPEDIQPEVLPDGVEEQLIHEAKDKKINRRLKVIFLEFLISSIVYLICLAFNRFKDLTGEIASPVAYTYTKFVMYFAFGVTAIGLVIFLLILLKVKLPIKFKVKETFHDILDWLVLLPLCVTIATFCFTFLFTFTVVKGTSMEPNYYEGNQLLMVYKQNYDRFDVVVIKVEMEKYGVREDSLYLKRIIGMPGDEINYVYNGAKQITELYVNGKVVAEEFFSADELKKREYMTYNGNGVTDSFNWYEKCFDYDNGTKKNCERVNGKSIIPEGYYFVLGDHRYVSYDSRRIGLIHEEDLIGKIVSTNGK